MTLNKKIAYPFVLREEVALKFSPMLTCESWHIFTIRSYFSETKTSFKKLK